VSRISRIGGFAVPWSNCDLDFDVSPNISFSTPSLRVSVLEVPSLSSEDAPANAVLLHSGGAKLLLESDDDPHPASMLQAKRTTAANASFI
jgi:hypothetical protein